MESILRLVAPWAVVVVLLLPFQEGDTNTAVFRSMFGDPVAPGELQSIHCLSTCRVVNVDEGSWWDSGMRLEFVALSPVSQCMMVFNDGIEGGLGCSIKFGAVVPDGPSFVGNWMGWGCGVDSRDLMIPIGFGKAIHFFIELFSSCQEVFTFLVQLVALHMLWDNGDGTVFDQGVEAADQIIALLAGVG